MQIAINYLLDYENVDHQKWLKVLAQHNDPGVRKTIAQLYNAPKSILKILTKDSDSSVSQSAKNTLS